MTNLFNSVSDSCYLFIYLFLIYLFIYLFTYFFILFYFFVFWGEAYFPVSKYW